MIASIRRACSVVADALGHRAAQRSSRTLPTLLLVIAIAPLTGCVGTNDRPKLGTVTGKVTLDGQPLAGAGVSFQPQELRASLGYTDKQGRYELTYLRDIKGAAVGTHQVRIDRMPQTEGAPVKHLPARYNRETELTREVTPGSNVVDFELTSEE